MAQRRVGIPIVSEFQIKEMTFPLSSHFERNNFRKLMIVSPSSKLLVQELKSVFQQNDQENRRKIECHF